MVSGTHWGSWNIQVRDKGKLLQLGFNLSNSRIHVNVSLDLEDLGTVIFRTPAPLRPIPTMAESWSRTGVSKAANSPTSLSQPRSCS